jgi:WD40 repeat protein
LIASSPIPSERPIRDFALAVVRDRQVLVCADWANKVWVWDIAQDLWTEQPLAELELPDFGHVAVEVVGEQLLFAAGGEDQGPALWDLMTGELLSRSTQPCARSLALTQVDGQAVIVGGVVAQLDERPVVVSSGADTVLVSDLAQGELIYELQCDGVSGPVALAEVAGRPVVLAATLHGEVRAWTDGGSTGQPLTGHEKRVSALTTMTMGGRAFAVTGGEDGTARVWDLVRQEQFGDPLAEHHGEVWTVGVTTLDDHRVVLTAGRDGVVRVWDPIA